MLGTLARAGAVLDLFTTDEPEAVEAFLICRQCAVAEPCLTFALDRPALVGIWAATTSEERARMRRLRQRRSPLPRPDPERP